MLTVTWTLPGKAPESREFLDDRLQELMDRANAKFGNPDKILDGPYMKVESDTGSTPIPKPRRKR